MNADRIALYVQVLIFVVPFFFWDDIRNVAVKFSLVLFVIIFYGYAFFRLMESYLKKSNQPQAEKQPKDRYVWLGILLQVLVLVMFDQYFNKVT